MRVKLAQAGGGGGCTATPFKYIYHHQKSCSIRSSWVGRHTNPVSSLGKYDSVIVTLKMLLGCRLWFCKIIPEAACDKLILAHFTFSQWEVATREHWLITAKGNLRRISVSIFNGKFKEANRKVIIVQGIVRRFENHQPINTESTVGAQSIARLCQNLINCRRNICAHKRHRKLRFFFI